MENPDPTRYRVNPRYFFASNREIRRLAPRISPPGAAICVRRAAISASPCRIHGPACVTAIRDRPIG